MSAWGDFGIQAAGALLGTLAGGAISVLVARWQTLRTLDAQSQLAAAQERSASELARLERERERITVAASALLERLADLKADLPSVPEIDEETPRFARAALERCGMAMQSVRRGMHTELMAISSPEVRERYRMLVKLTYDVAWRGVGRGNRERQIWDIGNYLRYVGHSLECLIEGRDIPPHAEPPVLDRSGAEAWLPPFPVPYWDDPADGS
ncbi:hypothetical protein LO772_17080 [Yinghuangia sp. ASG 101]|uniref:hypothetical protein n=1 Tax=Yinghuangia sp. ASG 101 TaxID=2896848 RepID=UPI001E5A8488|nr:hypothetical protein [Yinghuangia sp. ASG 101]UGQ15125.1 hypothetical protein LO772_17080 [Yinghuangia sp. ASG 101]